MKRTNWDSRRVVASATRPGVELVVARISFGRRLELMKRIRDLAARAEFHEAAADKKGHMEARLLEAEIDRIYVEWGVEEIRGLQVDGVPATVESLIERGPELLFREALEAVRSECGLNETERKN